MPSPAPRPTLGPCQSYDPIVPACPVSAAPLPSYDPAHPPACDDPGNPPNACDLPSPSPPPFSNNNWDWTLRAEVCKAFSAATMGALLKDKVTVRRPYLGQCGYDGKKVTRQGNTNMVSVGFYNANALFLVDQTAGNPPVAGVGDRARLYRGPDGMVGLTVFKGKYAVIVGAIVDGNYSRTLAVAKVTALAALKWAMVNRLPLRVPPTISTPYPG